MQQVDFAEVHASQAHTGYGLVAVCLAAAFPVDLFVAAWQVDQQMCAGIVMARSAGSLEDVQQAHPVAVHDQPESLLR